ncbi:SCO family protein [Microvirga sp. W0021]|uniref:SCO family protein n=1 Tax=Hohaiivirga grylli TaxID=3133970 RepID=A0ABV0BH09_9HYPH
MNRKFLAVLAFAFIAIGLLSGAFYFLAGNERTSGSGSAAIGGPFTLTDVKGKPFSSESLKGKPYLVFFGFTHCPEVCPTTLFDLTQDMKELGPDADKLNIVFISVDPERDTPELIETYLSNFDERIIGLTGTPDQIAEIARSFKAFYRKVPTSDGDYTVDHQVTIYMMDRQGRFALASNYQENQETRLAKIKRVIAGS